MRIGGRHYRTIWLADDGERVAIIDQTRLPHELVVAELASLEEAARAIETMQVRGAPLIGATAAYGLCLALRDDPSHRGLVAACERLLATRPTAVNLCWAVARVREALEPLAEADRMAAAYNLAADICNQEVELCRRIGEHGRALLEGLAEAKAGGPINVLTHCNAGWLATVDWGTALAPVYAAHDAGLDLHVWVDETRPRNQGAALTAFELSSYGVPHTVVVDNAGGHLMQHGLVDCCLVGSDRTTAQGDVANKVGTYLKALAAHDNAVPFYVALPHTTIDWELTDGLTEIVIEERDPREVTHVRGALGDGRVAEVRITPAASPAANIAFDVTPARLVTALITDRGVCPASATGLSSLFPERRRR